TAWMHNKFGTAGNANFAKLGNALLGGQADLLLTMVRLIDYLDVEPLRSHGQRVEHETLYRLGGPPSGRMRSRRASGPEDLPYLPMDGLPPMMTIARLLSGDLQRRIYLQKDKTP